MKTVEMRVTMTVHCSELCNEARMIVDREGVDPDLVCLECILPDHQTNYKYGADKGKLEVKKVGETNGDRANQQAHEAQEKVDAGG